VFTAVAEAITRARRIVPAGTPARYDAAVLKEPAEVALHEAVSRVGPATDLIGFAREAAPLVGPVHRFFDEVFVMADDPALRAARLGLLATVAGLGADLLDWPQLRL
jgi:glycyl-tRNA synthetase